MTSILLESTVLVWAQVACNHDIYGHLEFASTMNHFIEPRKKGAFGARILGSHHDSVASARAATKQPIRETEKTLRDWTALGGRETKRDTSCEATFGCQRWRLPYGAVHIPFGDTVNSDISVQISYKV